MSAGKGAFKGVTSVFRRGDKDIHDTPVVVDLPAGQSSNPTGVPAAMGGQSEPFPSNSQNFATEGFLSTQAGTLRLTILGAKDIALSETRAYVTIRVGDKEFKTKHYHKTATPEW